MSNSHKNVVQADAHAPAVHVSTHAAGGSDPITGAIAPTTIELGHASDTTIARASAGNLTVEGNALYRAGGTDVAVADGGTGASTAAAGMDALSPVTTRGDIIVRSATTNARLALGAAGKVLTSDGTDAVWGQGPLTTTGDLILGATGGTPTRLAIGANTYVLTSNGTTAAWAAAAATAPAFHGCVAVRSTDQTGVVTGTDTAISWTGTDDFDTDAYHDPASNASRITVPSGQGGYYDIKAGVVWDTNATGHRHIWLRKNGTTVVSSIVRNAATASYLAQFVSAHVQLGIGDYVEAIVFQDSGSNRTLSFGTLFNDRFSAALVGT